MDNTEKEIKLLSENIGESVRITNISYTNVFKNLKNNYDFKNSISNSFISHFI